VDFSFVPEAGSVAEEALEDPDDEDRDSTAADASFEFFSPLLFPSLSESLVVGKGGGVKSLGFVSTVCVVVAFSVPSAVDDENLRG
jgi:hypothetical protein